MRHPFSRGHGCETVGLHDRGHADLDLGTCGFSFESSGLDCDACNFEVGVGFDDRQAAGILGLGHLGRQRGQRLGPRGDRSAERVERLEWCVTLQRDDLDGQSLFPEFPLESVFDLLERGLGEVDGGLQFQRLAVLGEGSLERVLQRLLHAGDVDLGVVEAHVLEELVQLERHAESLRDHDSGVLGADLGGRPEVKLVGQRYFLGRKLADALSSARVCHLAGECAVGHVVPLHLHRDDTHDLGPWVENKVPGRDEALRGALAIETHDRVSRCFGDDQALAEVQPQQANHYDSDSNRRQHGILHCGFLSRNLRPYIIAQSIKKSTPWIERLT